MDAAITLDRLTKRYGRLTAVRDLSFEVRTGEVFGFLGLNGAGKTTTIRTVLDLLRPTSGRAFVFGLDCQKDGLAARLEVGYLPGELGIPGDMTGRQVLDLLARLSGRTVDLEARNRLLERLRLSHADLGRRVREYSTGMKRKLGIVQALQHDPRLLVLDEPTEGLDPLMQDEFFGLIAESTARGRTVFLSSHVLSEVERACARVALLREGELALLSSVSDLQAMAPRRVRVVFAGVAPPAPPLPPETRVVGRGERAWEVEAHGPIGALVAALAGHDVVDVQVRAPRLEDILSSYYRRSDS
jgi:ABC-2 type transport system ATP-binding protein